MSKIAVLSKEISELIAAGEVIERPASVVKEVVENAIDAEAKHITVEIKHGGTTYMRVADDGSGIASEDVPTAFFRHATSKIHDRKDLESIYTLGFRGEALASIAAVSKVTLLTKRREDDYGTHYEIIGGTPTGEPEQGGCPDGTTIIIRDLFFNVPVRQRFMKKDVTEANAVSQIVQKIALSHPEISFQMIRDNRMEFCTDGNGDLYAAIYALFGKEFAHDLIPVQYDDGFLRVSGYVGKPLYSKSNRTFQHFFINGRYIRSRVCSVALESAYQNLIMTGKFPTCVLMLEMLPVDLDVNVHPTKMEIRFRNGREIYELVVDTVREALLQKDLVQDVLRETPKKKEQPKTKEVKKPEPFEVNRRKEETQKMDQTMKDFAQMRQSQTNQQGQGVQQIEKSSIVANSIGHRAKPEGMKQDRLKSESSQTAKKPTYAGLNYNTQKKEFPQYKTDELSSNQMTLREDPVFSVQARPDRKILGQLFKTYWLIEYEDQLFIMDQHAAHEKVNYERLMKNFKEKEIYSQRLEPPMVVTVSMMEAEALERYKDAFAGLGFTIESFGGNEYCIREVPANLYGIGERDLFMELLDAVSQENGIMDTEVIASKIATMACKMSIKGNQRVSLMEVEHLLDELMKLENPYQCPHGRPTIIKMSKYEIDKKFKRIV